jgi:hypothetical protein
VATPYRAVALEPGAELHPVWLESGHEMRARAVVLATAPSTVGFRSRRSSHTEASASSTRAGGAVDAAVACDVDLAVTGGRVEAASPKNALIIA